jgi:formylglycine-generating enzyme required for sulfatase activity
LSVELIVREPLGERALAADEFPLSIGGPGAVVIVPAPAAGPLAWIGLQDGQLFVQPAHEADDVLLNGARIAGSTWLRGGDVLDVAAGRLKLRLEDGRRLLEVVAGGADNVTAPPVVEAATSIGGAGAQDDERIEPVTFRRQASAALVERRVFPWRRVIVAAALAVLAAIAAMLFSSTPVQVAISPRPDFVRFDGGWPGFRLGSGHLLRPGKYTLVAGRKGYEELRVPVTIGEERQRLEHGLVALPGVLRIELPVPGQVQIDGKVAGEAPGEFTLPAGRHALLIDTERYLDFATDVEVEGLGKQQVLAPKLIPGWSNVSVATEPAGAELRAGESVIGKTPLEFELMAGSHRLELRRDGFKPWTSDVQVKANEPLVIGPVRLGLPDGRLALRSTPAGASVTIGGAYRGRTPLVVEVRPEITHRIVISREGYEPASRELAVAPADRAALDVELAPILGEVIVRASPPDAQLLVDGVDKGAANQPLRLPSTRHDIEIRKAGYAPHRTTVTPRPGLPQNVEVTLLEGVARPAASVATSAAAGAGEAPAAPPVVTGLVPVIHTKGGQELKLVPAGSYTMGSPRREAGRRANESQRPVELRRRFYLATREVTNAEFRQFRPAHRSGFILQETLELDRQPVVDVSWQDAAAYCNWLSAAEGLTPAYEQKGGRLVPVSPVPDGYRLPTEAEWEWAARGAGGALRKYPWGDTLPVPAGAGNFADRKAQPLLPSVLPDYDDGRAATAPVGSYAPNAAGFFDLGGNVAEWTHDLYTVQPPGGAVVVDPVAAGDGALRVIRGSSWKHSAVTELRLAYRDQGDGKRNDLGFRIARYAQ